MTRNPIFLKNKFFVKFTICACWTKNATVLTICPSMLFTVCTISLYFQNTYIFLKMFLVKTYYIVCNIFNIRD